MLIWNLQNHHTVDDVAAIKNVVNQAKVLVRVNPVHDALPNYSSSKDEIDAVINAGADIIMLPFFKTIREVEEFIGYVDNRAKTCLLVETPEAAGILEQIIKVPGIDMIHIGLADGSVDKWAKIIKDEGIPFGFGGLASLDGGIIPGRMILKEHYRLGSQMVIVSRSFCNADKISDLEEIRNVFVKGINEIRALEQECQHQSAEYFEKNHAATVNAIEQFLKAN